MSSVAAPDPDDWQADAACLHDHRPDDWFLEQGSDVVRALTICGRCTVRPDCLAHALIAGETSGIWGGKTPDQLDAIRDEARRRSRGSRMEPL